MDVSLTIGGTVALFSTMLVLALVPSLSVITVSARSATLGIVHGAFTALGVVVGDVVFILIAILGLASIPESIDGLFVVLKYVGGAYLVWLGIRMWNSRAQYQEVKNTGTGSVGSSFLAGFLLTLSDQKAILFYLVFFPAFVDLSKITIIDAVIIVTIAAVSVGGAKLGYAFMADRARLLLSPNVHRILSATAAFVMISVGLLLILKP